MKYGDTNTWKGRQIKKHGHTVKPATKRYFEGKRWLANKARKVAKVLKVAPSDE